MEGLQEGFALRRDYNKGLCAWILQSPQIGMQEENKRQFTFLRQEIDTSMVWEEHDSFSGDLAMLNEHIIVKSTACVNRTTHTLQFHWTGDSIVHMTFRGGGHFHSFWIMWELLILVSRWCILGIVLHLWLFIPSYTKIRDKPKHVILVLVLSILSQCTLDSGKHFKMKGQKDT